MSECIDGWSKDKAPYGSCPAFFEPFENEGFCELGAFDDHEGTHQPDSCKFAPLLKALPSASEDRIRFATLILQGDGDMVEEEYPFTEEARKRIPVLGVKQEWHNFMPAEREKGESDE